MGNCCKTFAPEVDREENPVESLSMHCEGDQSDEQATTSLHVHAGWPSWMDKDAGEAFMGWLPRNEKSFRILEKIGEDTYSIVYRALDLEKRKTVALKNIELNDLEPETIRFMAREINILRRLNHPNIIKLEGLVASERSCNFYLVFEYMEHDLAELASRPGLKFTEPQVKCYMRQLFCGLDYCHSQGILHRDIKGSNLLLDNNGNLKIADFGLANRYDPEQVRPLTDHVVSLWYRSPELLLGAPSYGCAVDLWSAGCILAELYAGRPIFPGTTEVDQLHRIFTLCGSPSEDYWSLLKLPPADIYNPQKPFRRCVAEIFSSLSAPAVALIETLLSLDPAARQSARHALNSEYFLSEPLPCKPEELPKYPPSKELNAIVRDEEARSCRQAAGGNKGGIYNDKGKGKMKHQNIPALDINAELYLLMLKWKAQDNPWSQQLEPRQSEAASASSTESPQPEAQNEEISGPEGILPKGYLGHQHRLSSSNTHHSRPLAAPTAYRPEQTRVQGVTISLPTNTLVIGSRGSVKGSQQ